MNLSGKKLQQSIFRAIYSALCLLFLVPHSLQGQHDINADNIPEILFNTPGDEGESLSWYGLDLLTEQVIPLGTFAPNNSQVVYGHWRSVSDVSRVSVAKDSRGFFTLVHDSGSQPSVPFGLMVDKAQVLLGRDVDLSGMSDAVLMGGSRKKWSWRFVLDPFTTGSPSFQRILFGPRRGQPFLLKWHGSREYLTVLESFSGGRRQRMIYRSFQSRFQHRKRLRSRVFKIVSSFRISPRREVLVTLISAESHHLTLNRQGKFSLMSVPSSSFPIFIDSNGDGVDEVFEYVNGLIRTTTANTPLGLDRVVFQSTQQQREYEESDVIGTELPLASPTPKEPAVQTGTAIITYTPPSLPSSTALPSPTVDVPTATAINTSTATATSTSTHTPTATPTATSTSTFTPTATPTATPLFSDDFNDGIFSSALWNRYNYGNGEALAFEGAGVLTFTIPNNNAAMCSSSCGSEIISWNTFDFTNRNMTWKNGAIPVMSNSGGVYVSAYFNNNESFTFTVIGGNLIARRRIAGTTVDLVNTPFNLSNHRYLAIRHKSLTDLIYYETSPDGVNWTTVVAVARPFAITSLRPKVLWYQSTTSTTTGDYSIDDFAIY